MGFVLVALHGHFLLDNPHQFLSDNKKRWTLPFRQKNYLDHRTLRMSKPAAEETGRLYSSLHDIFYPRSVAVIGVSTKEDNLARRIVENLITFDFQGLIYQVGTRPGVLYGRRIYCSVEDIPDQVDLAVILTPAATVPDILEQCVRKGVQGAVIESAGFNEFGPDGARLAEQLIEIARRSGIRFIGPNGLGIINLENGLVLPFSRLQNLFRKGGISIISQSGGVGLSYLNALASENLGLAKFASIGNKLNLDENDLLEYLLKDPATDIICMYLEGINDGKHLLSLARQAQKPILLHKSNIGRLGNSIAKSHTVALSSDDKVVDAALRQCGIIRFQDQNTLINYLKILPLPAIRGNRLAILSRSGGHAVIAADACEQSGFTLTSFEPSFLREIESHFRANVITLSNPLDLGDLFDYEVYTRIVQRTIQEPNVDGIVFLHTYFSRTEGELSRTLFQRLEELSFRYQKPIAICVATDEEELSNLKRSLPNPIFTTPTDAIHALELLKGYAREQAKPRTVPELPEVEADRDTVAAIIARCTEEHRDPALDEATEIFHAYRIRVVPHARAMDAEDAVKAARTIGYPVVLKVISPEVSHKSDLGGVQLNLKTDEGVRMAYNDMLDRIHQRLPQAAIQAVLVQPMIMEGRELILGARQDMQFGPIVLLGMGGIFVEVFKEVAIRVVPFSREEAFSMFAELRTGKILEGIRGQEPFDRESAVDCMLRLARLVYDFPEIKEVDINPVRIFRKGEGCMALDARIVLRQGQGER